MQGRRLPRVLRLHAGRPVPRFFDIDDRLEALTAWIDRYRLVREEQFRRLDAVLDTRAADRGEHTQD